MDIGHVLAIGGESVIPAKAVEDVQASGASVTRLSGPSRFETAKAIAEFALRASAPSSSNVNPGLNFAQHQPLLANGGLTNMTTPDNTKWADALTAGAWAARTDRVIALTSTTTLPEPTKALLSENKDKFDPLVALGLGFAVSTEVLNAANALVAN